MSLKPLGLLKELVESLGMGISYAYEDLVLLDHNAFLLQFGEETNTIIVHTNSEADRKEAEKAIAKLQQEGASVGLEIYDGTLYTLSQNPDETIAIKFHD